MKNIKLTDKEIVQIARMPLRMRGTYITWRAGLEPYFLMSRETYQRHRKWFKDELGIDIKSKPPV